MTTKLNPDQTVELNVSLHRAFKEALGVQDACNLTGIVHSYERVVDLVRADLHRFTWTATVMFGYHPIAVLWASKLHDLSRLGASDPQRYGLAWEFADAVVKGAWIVGSEAYKLELCDYMNQYHRAV